MTAIADTGYVVSIANRDDDTHQRCLTVHQKQEIIYLPQSTLAEIGYMLRREGGNLMMADFLFGLEKSKYQIVALEAEDLHRTAELLQQYHDARLDFVDATIVAAAERMNIIHILTLDQRDFRMVRPKHAPYFELLP